MQPHLVIVSDAWKPQVNGVVTTLTRTCDYLTAQGVRVTVLGPDRFRSLPMPGYAEIRLAVLPRLRLHAMLNALEPDAIHIATEGPLGWSARAYCQANGRRFSSSFHTRFAEYVRARIPVPERWCWAWLRRFHRASCVTLVATKALEDELRGRGFGRMTRWSRGVDLEQFHARLTPANRARAQLVYMGRVAPEKNVEAFLALQGQIDADLVVVGDGPSRAALASRYPQVEWRGYQSGAVLRDSLADADVMVFPSRTDTFGLVMIEAMACGTPVAAFPEQGPLEVIEPGISGGIDESLLAAVKQALSCERSSVRRRAEAFSWAACGAQFMAAMPFGDASETVTQLSPESHKTVTRAMDAQIKP